MPKQFVAVKFQSNSMRRYTYHFEGEPKLAVGDKVDVETERGIITVEVTDVDLAEPDFATRPCVRLSKPEPAPEPETPPPPPAQAAERAPRRPSGKPTKREVRELASDLSRGGSVAPEGEDQQ